MPTIRVGWMRDVLRSQTRAEMQTYLTYSSNNNIELVQTDAQGFFHKTVAIGQRHKRFATQHRHFLPACTMGSIKGREYAISLIGARGSSCDSQQTYVLMVAGNSDSWKSSAVADFHHSNVDTKPFSISLRSPRLSGCPCQSTNRKTNAQVVIR